MIVWEAQVYVPAWLALSMAVALQRIDLTTLEKSCIVLKAEILLDHLRKLEATCDHPA